MSSVRASVRQKVYDRDGLKCRYCGVLCVIWVGPPFWRPPAPQNMATIDHVIPRVKGGGNNLENLATACRKCNHAKGDRGWPGMPKKWPPEATATLGDVMRSA